MTTRNQSACTVSNPKRVFGLPADSVRLTAASECWPSGAAHPADGPASPAEKAAAAAGEQETMRGSHESASLAFAPCPRLRGNWPVAKRRKPWTLNRDALVTEPLARLSARPGRWPPRTRCWRGMFRDLVGVATSKPWRCAPTKATAIGLQHRPRLCLRPTEVGCRRWRPGRAKAGASSDWYCRCSPRSGAGCLVWLRSWCRRGTCQIVGSRARRPIAG